MPSKRSDILFQSTIDPLLLSTVKSGGKLPLTISIVCSIIVAMVMILTNGNFAAAAAIPLLIVVIVLSIYRLDWGFCIFTGMILFFDQFPIRGYYPFTSLVSYFTNLKQVPYIPSFEAGVVTPMELHLLFLFCIWLAITATKKTIEFTPVKIWFATLLFFLWLIASFIWGRMRGGDFLSSLWEMRALFYLCIMYVYVPQVIHTKKQVQTLMWVCIAAISFKAFQGIFRFVSLGFTMGGFDELTNSEDPIFMITLIVLLIGLLLFGGHNKQRRALLWLLFPLVLGIYVGQRRATYASFIITMIAFIILLPKRESRILFKYFIVILLAFSVYIAMFWNSSSEFGIVAQKIKSMFYTDPTKITTRDYYSNLYRDYENYNLSMTIRHSPMLGIGFGHKYEHWLTWWGLEDTGLLGYIPHNSILWLMAKTGAYGLGLFFFFMNSYLFVGASMFHKLKDPYLKSVSAMCILAVVNQIVVVFVEMHLSFYRTMVYMGILMGLLTVLELIEKTETEASVKPTE